MHCIALIQDLIFISKIRQCADAQGATLATVRDKTSLLSAYQTKKPDLIIVDLNLKSENAITLLQELKSVVGETPLIGFLSHVDTELWERARRADLVTLKLMARSKFVEMLPSLFTKETINA